jgi:hypothetical protein
MKRYITLLFLSALWSTMAVLLATNRVSAAPDQQSHPSSQQPTDSTTATTKTPEQQPSATYERPHAYHKDLPTGPLPATLDPYDVVKRIKLPQYVPAAIVAYSIAAKVKEELYQVPCYCGCDKSSGHESLLNCFTTVHGAACPTCQMELIFVYEQTKAGKTAPEIRQDMEKGKWGSNVADYMKKHYPEYAKPENPQPPTVN